MRAGTRRFLAIVAGYTALGFLLAAAQYLTYLSTSGKADWGATLKRSLGEWYGWAALTPLIIRLAERRPIQRGAIVRHSAIHVGAMLAIGAFKLLLDHWVRYLMFGAGGYLLFTSLAFNFLVYWAIVAATHGASYYRTGRERELRSSQLETRLAETRLQLLGMQLQPHFLFNTLNAIAELVHEDPETAERMIAGLSRLLRETLDAADAPAVELRRELDLLGCYVEIQRVRFGPRLNVTTTADLGALAAAVPILLLQTLVENSIRHGLARRSRAGRIDVSVRREHGLVTIRVADDGEGLPLERSEGVGLSNTRARLEGLYGSAHSLEVSNKPDGGVVVTVTFPYREVDELPAPADAESGG